LGKKEKIQGNKQGQLGVGEISTRDSKLDLDLLKSLIQARLQIVNMEWGEDAREGEAQGRDRKVGCPCLPQQFRTKWERWDHKL